MKILDNAQRDGVTAPVVPMALTNLWGSFFSRVEKNGAMVRPFRRGMFSRVGLNVGAAIQPANVQLTSLQASVVKLTLM
jgi:1-acyl-sn-glycerol-3-phosphate acyltransferase